LTNKSNKETTKRIRILFYSSWFIGLLIQAYFTELNEDEAYYWMYSRKLSWGYFDHPPIIALIIKLGYYLFQNELGIRLIPIILSTCTLMIWEKIIQPKEIKTYVLLLLSVGILHFNNFIATPDVPLIFFTSLFLLTLKRFLPKPNLLDSIALGIFGALMILSKYHGVLILAAIVLANFKLINSRFFWIIFTVIIILLTPHILWQIETDYPSLKYHFYERSSALYSVNFSIEYLLSQLFVLGPFTGILFFISAYKIHSKNQFEKTLKYIFWILYAFFFLLTFKGRVEAHWTLITIIPAMYFGYHYLIQYTKNQKAIRFLFYISLGLILSSRILISIDMDSNNNSIIATLTKSFRNKSKMIAIHNESNNSPVAFMNSYQNASLYQFYTGSESFSLNNIMGRKNQFDLWNAEDIYRGQKIMVVLNYNNKKFDSIKNISETLRYKFINNFQSFSTIQIFPIDLKETANTSDTLNIKVHFKTKNKVDIEKSNNDYPSFISYHFFKGDQLIKQGVHFRIDNQKLNSVNNLKVVTPNDPGKYRLHLSIRTGWLPPTINSNSYEIEIK
jgi:hypothetical protein